MFSQKPPSQNPDTFCRGIYLLDTHVFTFWAVESSYIHHTLYQIGWLLALRTWHYVVQAGLELSAVLLPLLDYRRAVLFKNQSHRFCSNR